MFSEGGEFTVLRNGYEHTTPLLAQNQLSAASENVLETLKRAPDFVLQSINKREVWFVEVKYNSSSTDFTKNQEACIDISKTWPNTHLFIATQDGFFMDDIELIARGVEPKPLRDQVVPREVQVKYLEVLRRFILPNTSFTQHNSNF